MNHFITIFRKEFTDTIRDRRTLLVMVIFPLLLVPLMLTIVTNIQIASVRKAEDKSSGWALSPTPTGRPCRCPPARSGPQDHRRNAGGQPAVPDHARQPGCRRGHSA